MLVLLIIVLIILAVISSIFLIPGYTKPFKDENGNILQGSIASLEKMELGGRDQWVLIRGENIKNPVILFLHGGPGTADMCLIRRYMGELEKYFVVVSWDQRGAGKSFAAINPNSSMTINQFVADTAELSQNLCHRFGSEKIFLAGVQGSGAADRQQPAGPPAPRPNRRVSPPPLRPT